jgi:hypothetical protein
MEKKCANCGKIHSRRSRYCSTKCYNEAYYSTNVIELKKKSKKHYEENKQYYIDKATKKRKENPKKATEYMREWRKKKIREQMKEA